MTLNLSADATFANVSPAFAGMAQLAQVMTVKSYNLQIAICAVASLGLLIGAYLPL